MDSKVKEALEKKARNLGFDSAQAYIRVWAKAEVEGRKLDLDSNAVTLSSESASRYDKMSEDLEEQIRKGEVKEYATTEDFMKDL